MHQPSDMGAFQFVVLASLRAKQLTLGCIPRVDGSHKVATTAQMEVAQGKVTPGRTEPDVTDSETRLELEPAAYAG